MIEKFINPEYLKKNQKRIAVILMVFFMVCAWLIQSKEETSIDLNPTTDVESIDTYIPNGFVLVPIEIQNLNALDSLVGQFAIIDLYIPNHDQPLVSGVKLIRSPKDPSQFAVLVQDQLSQSIVKKSQNPFQVVVQNPKQNQVKIYHKPKLTRIKWED